MSSSIIAKRDILYCLLSEPLEINLRKLLPELPTPKGRLSFKPIFLRIFFLISAWRTFGDNVSLEIGKCLIFQIEFPSLPNIAPVGGGG